MRLSCVFALDVRRAVVAGRNGRRRQQLWSGRVWRWGGLMGTVWVSLNAKWAVISLPERRMRNARAPHLGPAPACLSPFTWSWEEACGKMSHRKARRWRRGVPARAGAVARRPAAAGPLALMWWSGSIGCSAGSACMAAPAGACRRPPCAGGGAAAAPREMRGGTRHDGRAASAGRARPAGTSAAALPQARSLPAGGLLRRLCC